MPEPPWRDRIQRHYDRLAFVYRRAWGEHIHHGYWDDPALPAARAQERLIEVLATEAGIPRGATILDVGCGFGGSALWLAERLGSRVVGLTLSRRQARIAAATRRRRLPNAAVWIAQADAETWPVRAESVDVVWMVETLEHLSDKPRCVLRVSQALRPGGVLALCAWMTGADDDGRAAEVAEAFLCPSLASPQAHASWAEAAGLRVDRLRDLTAFVRPTWRHGQRFVRRPWVRACVPFLDPDTRRFVHGFDAIARAYDEGALLYGLLVARKGASA